MQVVVPLEKPFKGFDGKMVTTRKALPCHKRLGAEIATCASRHFPTPEECEAEADRVERYVAELHARAERGECFHCGAKIERKRQVGPCIYAEPCGCRQGQGRLK